LYDLLQHVGCDYPTDVFDVLFEAAAGGAAAAAIADIQVRSNTSYTSFIYTSVLNSYESSTAYGTAFEVYCTARMY
jgi:hypothetical protein